MKQQGADQTFIVPEGIDKIRVEVWGAGGGDGRSAPYSGGAGYTFADIRVTPS